ncbi:MAG TPA: TIGR02391 family protein [Acidimicrobiales bacterium]|jgi:hypothetical protein|nr:TIGR02391 family protein [Acidimicrobiales bacterium]
MEAQLALNRVEEFLAFCERSIALQQASPSGYSRGVEWKSIENEITNRLPIIERIAAELDQRLADLLRTSDFATHNRNKLLASRELRGVLEHSEEIERILGPSGPKMSADQFHPWIWDHASALWADGYRRAAVQAAATALFDFHLPAKLERARDTRGGADLMGQAFSLRDPEVGAPRLRLPGYDRNADEKSWKSAHEGAMHLGQGCALAIRNLTTHDLTEPEEQTALEMLAALSLVARFVQDATLEWVVVVEL